MLIVILVVLAVGCSTPASSYPEAAERPELSEPAPPKLPQGAAIGGQSLIDSEELIGLGELGLLPSLLQTFGAGIDCDFDDAFSTCQ